MGSVPHYQNYREIIKHEWLQRKRTNPRFSLRSFSLFLGVQPAFLSFVLNGKRNLSDEMTERFIKKLKFTESKAKIFELLVKIERAASPELKNKLLDALKQIDPSRNQQHDLLVEDFSLISEWYHFALFMLIDVDGFSWSLPAVAKSLGITQKETVQALENLKHLKLIEFRPGQRPKKLQTRIILDHPNDGQSLKNYNLQLLELTRNAIEKPNRDERYIGNEMITLGKSQLPQAAEIFEECFRKIFSLSQQNLKEKEVYQVAIQLFPLTQIQKGRKKK